MLSKHKKRWKKDRNWVVLSFKQRHYVSYEDLNEQITWKRMLKEKGIDYIGKSYGPKGDRTHTMVFTKENFSKLIATML